MPTDFAQFFIPILTVIGAILTAYLTSLKTIKTEKEKIDSTIELTYANKLLDKRLSIYPEFYFVLSEMAKLLFYSNFTREAIFKFQKDIDVLDSKYMIFCSSIVTDSIAQLRRFLRVHLSLNDELDDDNKKTLNILIGNVENALKHDLGVYIVELDDPKRRINTITYDHIKSHYAKSKQGNKLTRWSKNIISSKHIKKLYE